MTQLIKGTNRDVEVFKTRIIKYESGKLIEHTPVLLLDTSGSMAEDINGQRKIDILKNAVESSANGIDIYCFSSQCIKTKYIPQPEGGTNLAGAFRDIKSVSSMYMHLVLVSDGMPDNVEEALHHGKLLSCPINVLYIGVSGDVGEGFMRQLASDTGGKWLTVDTFRDQATFQQKLSLGIAKLLLCDGEHI